MSWIRYADDPAAVGGRPHASNIERVMALHPEARDAAMSLHRALSEGMSALSDAEEEAIATAVSVINGCEY